MVADLLYREWRPDAVLQDHIECFWMIEARSPIQNAIAPDGCLDIIYSLAGGLQVIGAMTVQQTVPLTRGERVVGLRFRPGMARTALGIAPRELNDTSVDLSLLWPDRARESRAGLEDSASITQSLQALRRCLGTEPVAPNPVQCALGALAAAHGNVDLELLARQCNLGMRQFRRRTLEESGFSPKHLCRVLRFRRARQLARCASRPSWALIALEAGYFDQSHLIRDFVEFTGKSPTMSVSSNH